MSARAGGACRFRPRDRGAATLAALVLPLLLVLPVASCAGSEQPSSDTGAVGGAIRTYGATMPRPGPARLLKVDELRPLVAFGYDIREQPVLDPKQFNLAALRGPCGANVPTPFGSAGSTRVFRSTVTFVLEAIAEPGVVPARAVMDQLIADQQRGCPPFDEQIGSGGASKVAYEAPVELPAVGDQRVGWTHAVTAPDGKVGYRTVLVVRDGGRLTLFVVIAVRPVDPAQFTALVDTASAVR